MTPKEYLQRVRRLDVRVDQKVTELELMKKYPINASAWGEEKVQTSPSQDGVYLLVARIMEAQEEVNREIDNLIDLRQKVIREIQSLQNVVYEQILYKRYIEYKDLQEIAKEMNYSYDRLKHLHGMALLCFGGKVDTE